MNKRTFYLFIKKAREIFFTKENIESAQKAVDIKLYNLEKTLSIYMKKLFYIST